MRCQRTRRMGELEIAAGVYLLSPDFKKSNGEIDWDKYQAAVDALAAANPEYKALRDEHNAARKKKWAKQDARKNRVRELSSSLFPLLHSPSLTDEEKFALSVARELLWQCKPAAVERAEKTVRKESAKETASAS